MLRAKVTFAEDIITQLAEFLGIGPDRALGDYNHPDSDGGGEGLRLFGGDDDDFDEEDGSATSPSDIGKMMQKAQQQFAGLLAPPQGQRPSPECTALVEAAAAGNIAEVERLVEAGTDVNAMGELPLKTYGMSSLPANWG